MDKSKKAKTDEGPKKEEQVDAELVKAIEKLQEVQDEIEKVNEEASDKVLEIEQHYSIVRRPIFDKRNEIVTAIPDFWLTVFLSHPVLYAAIAEQDHKALKFLKSLDVEYSEDVKSGHTIIFRFAENPFFENKELKKDFKITEEGTVRITGTSIEWKEGQDLTKGAPKSDEKDGKKRPLEDVESFFRWFEVEEEEQDLDAIPDDIAEILKDDIWANPLKYFGQEPEGDDEDDDEDDEDDEDEEGEDGDDDEEDEGGDDEDDE